MFYSYTLLNKGGAFALIWELATLSERRLKGSSLTQKQKKELYRVDISKKCEELIRYIPTGVLSREEVENKMSLYLLAVLQYGIVVAYKRKVDMCLNDLKAVQQLLQPSLVKERVVSNTRTTAKRKRRHEPDEDEAPENVAILPEEADLLGPLPDATVRDMDANESSQNLRRITLDEFEPLRASPSSFLRPSLDAEQFNVDELMDVDMLRFSPASREAEMDIMDRAFSRQLDVDEEIQQMMAEFMEPHSDPFPMVELDRRSIEASSAPFLEFMAESFPVDADPSRAPLVALENMELDQIAPELEESRPADIVDKENVSPLRLDTLTDSQILEDVRDIRRGRTRRRTQNLIIDETIALDDDEMREQMNSFSDICTTHKRFDEIVSYIRQTAEELLRPYPSYLPFNEEWADMFMQATLDASDRRIEREEARREELERTAELTLQQDNVPQPEQLEVSPAPQPDAFQLSTELEIPLEQHPDTVGAWGQPLPADIEAQGFVQPVAPPLQFEPEFEQYPEEMQQIRQGLDESSMHVEMAREGRMDSHRVSSLTGGKSPLPMADEFPSTIMTPTGDSSTRQSPIQQAEELMDRLTEVHEPEIVFNEIMHKITKKRAARDFFNLLALLKEKKVSAVQPEPFAPITVTLL